jgi:hypothetical protein
MPDTLNVHVFRDPHFAPEGDTLVCIAERTKMERFIGKDEVEWAFSGHAVYRSKGRTKSGILSFVTALIWRRHTYVGVWGRKNASRFRRFLRERGAEIEIQRHAPPDVRLAYWTTANERRKVRSLPQRQA